MATNDADGGNTAATRPADKPSAQNTQIDKRLEPLEEFRSRAEGWMKEVTAQVARLAGSFEHEDKKRQALEDRLADIEERIRSLLTLTELVSLDKNPFAGSPSHSAAQNAPTAGATAPAPAQTPAPSPSQPPTPTPADAPEEQVPPIVDSQDPTAEAPGAQETTPTRADGEDDEEGGEKDLEPPIPAADRPGVEVIPVGPPRTSASGEPAPPAPEQDEPTPSQTEAGHEEMADEHADQHAPATVDLALPQEPEPTGTGALEAEEDPQQPAQNLSSETAGLSNETEGQEEGQTREDNREDNREDTPLEKSVPASSPSSLAPEQDPTAKPVQTHHPNDAQAEAAPPAPEPAPRPASQDPAARAETSRRLLVVAWADLLAPAAEQVDVKGFTGFYVEAQWVDEDTARLVNRLVEEISPHVTSPQRPDVRGLHEATVRLLFEHDPDLTSFDRVDEADEDSPTEDTDYTITNSNAT